MTDTGSNPFAEPDFSSLHPSGTDDHSDEDYDDEEEDADIDDVDEQVEEDEDLDDEAGEEDDFDEADATGADVAQAAPASPDLGADDAGNRVAGGTARSVLEHVARSIVDDPEGVTVEVAENRGGVRLSLHVAQGDMGRIIGRRGRTAQALRTLVRAAAARDGQEASVDIVD